MPMSTSEIADEHTFVVSRAVDAAMQLDNCAAGYGLDPSKIKHKRGGVAITATLDQLAHFATFLGFDAVPDGLAVVTRYAMDRWRRRIERYVRNARANTRTT